MGAWIRASKGGQNDSVGSIISDRYTYELFVSNTFLVPISTAKEIVDDGRYLLIQIMMTLCNDFRIDFLIYDFLHHQLQIFQDGGKEFSKFRSSLTRSVDLDFAKAQRKAYFDKHSLIYNGKFNQVLTASSYFTRHVPLLINFNSRERGITQPVAKLQREAKVSKTRRKNS